MPVRTSGTSTPVADAGMFSVFGWRYASRLQTERTIAVSRVVLAGASLFAVWMDPAEPERYVQLTYALHAIYVLYSLLLTLIVYVRLGPNRLPLVTHIIDIIVFSVFQYLTLGPSSPFFMYFLFAIFSGALRWGWRGTLVTAVTVLLSFVVMGDSMSLTFGAAEFELNRFIIRAVYLAVAAGLLVYLGQHEARLRAQIERLAGWPSVGQADADAVVRQLLAYAADIVSAPRAIVIWEQGDEPVRHVASWTAEQFSMTRADESTALVAPALDGAAFVTTDHVGSNSVVVISRGDMLSEWRGEPVEASLLPGGSAKSMVSAPFRTEQVSGRLLLLDLVLPSPEMLPLTEVIAREIGASLDQFYVTARLTKIAASEERIRVARDLHDGVLQSLTALRLDLQSVATSRSADLPPETRERLHGIERAIAMEQRELRLFIAGLQPDSRPDVVRGSLAERLEAVRGRIELEWKMPVTVRVGACPDPLPDAVLQGVALMVHEGVVNALKHGHPSQVSIDVQGQNGRLQIVIADDGRGFPFIGRYDDASLAQLGAGPVSLRSRVASLGGQTTIESAPTGSRIEILLPLVAGSR